MFFRRKKKEEKKKKSTVDKIIMGAIIGTAVGSVIGLTVAPKKGKDTREFLKDTYDNRKDILDKGKQHISDHRDDVTEITKLAKETAVGVGTLVKNFIFGRKKEERTPEEREHYGIKKIPNEMEIPEPTLDETSE